MAGLRDETNETAGSIITTNHDQVKQVLKRVNQLSTTPISIQNYCKLPANWTATQSV
jgi:hypothetical protein